MRVCHQLRTQSLLREIYEKCYDEETRVCKLMVCSVPDLDRRALVVVLVGSHLSVCVCEFGFVRVCVCTDGGGRASSRLQKKINHRKLRRSKLGPGIV